MKWKCIAGVVIGSLICSVNAAMFSHGAATDQGIAVFNAQKCSLCHSINGSGGKKALDGVGARLKPDGFKKRIKTPKEVKADSGMKAYPNLPEKDINDLVDYLMTLR